MVCDPNEHNFVKRTSYSVEIETDSAIVKEGTEEKKCEHCGKTPDELGDFVSQEETSETDSIEESDSDSNYNSEQNDDAVIIGSDNSETQSSSENSNINNSEPTEQTYSEGEQDDDAYIIESEDTDSSTSTENNTTIAPSGPTLVCENCGFESPKSNTPHYPGDSCPECKKSYLEED